MIAEVIAGVVVLFAGVAACGAAVKCVTDRKADKDEQDFTTRQRSSSTSSSESFVHITLGDDQPGSNSGRRATHTGILHDTSANNSTQLTRRRATSPYPAVQLDVTSGSNVKKEDSNDIPELVNKRRRATHIGMTNDVSPKNSPGRRRRDTSPNPSARRPMETIRDQPSPKQTRNTNMANGQQHQSKRTSPGHNDSDKQKRPKSPSSPRLRLPGHADKEIEHTNHGKPPNSPKLMRPNRTSLAAHGQAEEQMNHGKPPSSPRLQRRMNLGLPEQADEMGDSTSPRLRRPSLLVPAQYDVKIQKPVSQGLTAPRIHTRRTSLAVYYQSEASKQRRKSPVLEITEEEDETEERKPLVNGKQKKKFFGRNR